MHTVVRRQMNTHYHLHLHQWPRLPKNWACLLPQRWNQGQLSLRENLLEIRLGLESPLSSFPSSLNYLWTQNGTKQNINLWQKSHTSNPTGRWTNDILRYQKATKLMVQWYNGNGTVFTCVNPMLKSQLSENTSVHKSLLFISFLTHYLFSLFLFHIYRCLIQLLLYVCIFSFYCKWSDEWKCVTVSERNRPNQFKRQIRIRCITSRN